MKLTKHRDGTCTLQGLTFDQIDYMMNGYFDAINSMIDYRANATETECKEWAKNRINEIRDERVEFEKIWDVMLKHEHGTYRKNLGL